MRRRPIAEATPRESARSKRPLRWRVLAVGSLVIAAGGVMVPHLEPASGVTATTRVAAPGTMRNKFLIGVWLAYPGGFTYWKSLGINTVAGMPVPPGGRNPLTYAGDWDAAVAAHGLLEARRPISDRPDTDPGRISSRMVAWILPDEPENNFAGPPVPVSTIARMYKADKVANPNRPVWISLIGGPLAGGYGIPVDRKYATWADWMSADDFAVAARRSPPIPDIGREMEGLSQVGSRFAGRMAFIEAGQISDPPRPVVTPQQMRAEIWEAIVHGARGIVYYTYTTNGPDTLPISVNNTTPAIRAMMKSQDWVIAHLPVGALQGAINPSAVAVSARAPLEAGWRASSRSRYMIVVNTSPQTHRMTIRIQGLGRHRSLSVFAEHRSIHLSTNGYATDTFAPYAVHVYCIG